MNGLLVIDKPIGPTSHDVVARIRRVLGEQRVGHTGTLDPAASGVFPIVVGTATRLARFLTAGRKTYEAIVRLGVETDTYDAEGAAIGSPYEGPMPSKDAIDRALDAFRGTFLQQPPAFSAKKVGGRRSYALARAAARNASSLPVPAAPPALPAPVSVTTDAVVIVAVSGCTLTLQVDCSAGFYVRSLAHDLGRALGTGGHLAALRRLRSGDFTIDDALGLEDVERSRDEAMGRLIPLSRMLPSMPAVHLTSEGVRRASHGMDLGPAELITKSGHSCLPDPAATAVSLRTQDGDLIAVAEPSARAGLLHPLVVLV